MTIVYPANVNISVNQRPEIRAFIVRAVDEDSDFRVCALSNLAGDYVEMRANWHDGHLTASVYHGGQYIGTAHVYQNEQVTMFP